MSDKRGGFDGLCDTINSGLKWLAIAAGIGIVLYVAFWVIFIVGFVCWNLHEGRKFNGDTKVTPTLSNTACPAGQYCDPNVPPPGFTGSPMGGYQPGDVADGHGGYTVGDREHPCKGHLFKLPAGATPTWLDGTSDVCPINWPDAPKECALVHCDKPSPIVIAPSPAIEPAPICDVNTDSSCREKAAADMCKSFGEKTGDVAFYLQNNAPVFCQ